MTQSEPGRAGPDDRGGMSRLTNDDDNMQPTFTTICAWLMLTSMVSPLCADERVTTPRTTVGIEGTYYLSYRGPKLKAKAVDERAPLVVRIADAVADDEDSTLTHYDVRYIANRAGEFELGEYLLTAEDARPTDLEPMRVKVGEVLPADHDGALEEMNAPGLPRLGGYRLALIAVGVMWLSPVVYVVVRRMARRPARVEAAVAGGPTLADQLRPLIESALRGEAPAERLAALERLLMAHWRDRLELADCAPTEAIRRMKAHEQAGALLRQLENWLHEPPQRRKADVAAMLEPYRHVSAVRQETEKPAGKGAAA